MDFVFHLLVENIRGRSVLVVTLQYDPVRVNVVPCLSYCLAGFAPWALCAQTLMRLRFGVIWALHVGSQTVYVLLDGHLSSLLIWCDFTQVIQAILNYTSPSLISFGTTELVVFLNDLRILLNASIKARKHSWEYVRGWWSLLLHTLQLSLPISIHHYGSVIFHFRLVHYHGVGIYCRV